MDKIKDNYTDTKSIFIVDDAEWHNILLKKLLCDDGYRVKAFTNGDILLKKLEEDPPHLVISDINMPDMDGFELCKMIKNSSQGSGVPVMFLSSLDEQQVKEKVSKNGGVGFLQKPFQKQSLLSVVAEKL